MFLQDFSFQHPVNPVGVMQVDAAPGWFAVPVERRFVVS
jgi:hypothetical protein